MCPECIATIAVAIAGVVSTGTATATVLKLFRSKKIAAQFSELSNRKEKASEHRNRRTQAP
jgi:hypothetical protein